MKPALTGETHAGAVHQRHRFDELRVEAELRSLLRIRLESLAMVLRALAERDMQVSVHPGEACVDAFLADDVLDGGDGGHPGIPGRLRVRGTEALGEIGQPDVGHHGEVRGRVPGVDRGATIAIEQDDVLAGLGEEIGGGEPGDAAPDDEHVRLGVGGQFPEGRKRRGRGPIGDGVARSAGHGSR